MTRKEWFDNQTPKVRKEFKKNCEELNVSLTLEAWIKMGNTENIKNIEGAFVWDKSPQGHQYWFEINKKIEILTD